MLILEQLSVMFLIGINKLLTHVHYIITLNLICIVGWA